MVFESVMKKTIKSFLGRNTLLSQRDGVLRAVAQVAEQLLKVSDWENCIQDTLSTLGKATRVSRVYLFQTRASENGEPRSSLMYEWVADGISAQISNPKSQGLDYKSSGFLALKQKLDRGEPFHGNVRELPSDLKEEYTAQDIRSLAIVPILVDDDRWGSLGFDDCSEERDWSIELDALKAAAGILSAAIWRQKTQNALQAVEAKYQAIVEQVPAVFYTDSVDTTGLSLYVSPQIKTMMGYEPEEWAIDDTLWKKSILPEDRERVWAEYTHSINTGVTFETEYRIQRADGKLLWVHDSAVMVRDPMNRPISWQGIMLDITDRKRAEISLQESEERYHRLFDISPDAITVHGGGKILLVNRAAVSLMGAASPDQLIGKPMLDFVHPDYRQIVIERTHQQIENGKLVPVLEEKFIRLDGTTIDVDVTATPISFQDMVASLVIIRDITERKQAEEKLQRQFKELNVLHLVGQAITQASNLDELITLVTDAIGETLFSLNFGFLVVDEKADLLRHHFSYRGNATPEERAQFTIPLGKGITGTVARSGMPRRVADVRNDLDYINSNSFTRSELCVPVTINGKVAAVINTEGSNIGGFSEDDERLLITIAGQVAIAIEKLQLLETERLRRQEAETLRQAAAALTSSLEMDQVLEKLLDQLAQVIPYDSAAIFLLEEGMLRVDAVRGFPYPDQLLKKQFDADDELLAEAKNTLAPLIIDDVTTDPRFKKWGETTYTRGWMGTPIIARDQVIGYLTLDNRMIGAYTRHSADLAMALASQAAAVVENARLYQQALQAADRRAVLHHVSQDMVTAIREPEQTYRSIHQATRQLMPCDSFVVALHDETADENIIVYALEGDHRLPLQRLPGGKGLTGKVVAGGESIIVDDLIAEKTDVVRVGEPRMVNSLVAVPLRLGEKTTGMISAQSYNVSAYGPEERVLLEMLASYAAIAIENARLYQEAIRAAERRSILHEVSQEIVKVELDLELVYEAIHHAAERLMPADAFVISVVDEIHNQILFAYLYDQGKRWPSDTSAIGSGLSGRVIKTGKALFINDFQSTPLQEALAFGEGETRSILAVPLRLGTKVFGMLSVQSYQPRSYTEEDRALLEMLSAHAAVAIENARLYSETRRRLTELEAVNRISTALRRAQTAEQMLPCILDETLKILESSAGVIWLFSPPSGLLTRTEVRGWFGLIHEEPVRPGEGISGLVFNTGEPIISREFYTDERTREAIRRQIPPGWGGACVPIRTGDEIIGVLLVSVQLPRQLDENDAHLLATISEIAGSAIHRSSLYEHSQRQLQRLASLRAIDLAINTTLDLRVTLDILIDHIMTQLKVDAVSVLLMNSVTQTLQRGASAGFWTDAISKWQPNINENLSGHVVQSRSQVHVPNLAFEPRYRVQSFKAEGFITYFGVPLIAKGQVKGVLEIYHRSVLNPDTEWKSFLEILSGQAAIAIDNATLFEDLQKTNINLSLAYDATIEGWSRAMELRDRDTEGHTLRVADQTVQLARQMGLRDADLVHVRRGALLHDIGKMGVPDSILQKPGAFVEQEWEIMRRHPEYAYGMLAPIAYLRPSIDIPYCHHEHWDGTGYPRGLKGEQIPLAARIFAVVDVWDAITSDRPYRKAWKLKRAREYIRKNSGSHFDPVVVNAFLEMIESA
jgi:PAS domain S-box-containing protein/putative nucleotidyltransferase with HDIG domain